MRAEEQAQKAESKIKLWQLIKSPTLRLPLLIAIVMQLSQQLSGINAVSAYKLNVRLLRPTAYSKLYVRVGFLLLHQFIHHHRLEWIAREVCDDRHRRRHGDHDTDLNPANGQKWQEDAPSIRTRRNVHLLNIYHNLLPRKSTYVVDRENVLNENYSQELVSWIWWLSVVSTLFYVVFFAVGPGSIPWMITAELFSQGPRPAAMSIAVLINWCANFLVGIGFPTMQVPTCAYTGSVYVSSYFPSIPDCIGELHFFAV